MHRLFSKKIIYSLLVMILFSFVFFKNECLCNIVLKQPEKTPPKKTRLAAYGLKDRLKNTAPSKVFPKGTILSQNINTLFEKWENLIKKNDNTFLEITNFIKDHPDWPKQTFLQKKAESLLQYTDSDLNLNDADAKAIFTRIITFFKKFPPLTGNGQFIYARALLASGDTEQAQIEFLKLLTNFIIPTNLVQHLNDYKQYLPYQWAYIQANYMLIKENLSDVEALFPYLTEDEKKRIEIRRDLIQKKQSAVDEAYSLLESVGNNEGVIFDLIRYHASFDLPEEDQKAFALLSEHSFSDEAAHAEVFWKIRHKIARNLLSQNRPKDAYLVVKNHGYEIASSNKKCDEDCSNAFCTTSWLGIEYADDALNALNALQEIENAVKSPITKARIYYWMAKAHIALEKPDLAQNDLKKAAYFKSTFYGQIALSQLKNPRFFGNQSQSITSKKEPKGDNLFPKVAITKKQRDSFEKLELVKAIQKAPEVLQNENSDLFFYALVDVDQSLPFQQMVFDLATAKKSRSYAILLSKKYHMTFRDAYPLLQPSTQAATIDRIAPQTNYTAFLEPLVHAVIRRESAFDEEARSSANALGLMQLIQATANTEIKNLRRFDITVKKPANLFNKYQNILIGTSHLDTLLDEFDGSIVLALAAYNAGPTPVKRWIEIYGNPQSSSVDIINWIESIPYYETRNYVQRVLENMTIYEQLLAEQNQNNKETPTTLLQRIKPS